MTLKEEFSKNKNMKEVKVMDRVTNLKIEVEGESVMLNLVS